ncbi:MAG: hypothetical protein QM658_08490 [Gordonia sp. (in: high G+C Gram-positive bacteria)]
MTASTTPERLRRAANHQTESWPVYKVGVECAMSAASIVAIIVAIVLIAVL